MIAYAVAVDIAGLGLGTLSEVEGGDVFVQNMPSEPDEAVAVSSYGGQPQQTKAPTDLPLVQVRVRGTKHDPVTPYERARAIYSALNCRDNTLIAAGTVHEAWVIGCTAIQSDPISLGADENGRHEWAVNFAYRTAAPTTHRA